MLLTTFFFLGILAKSSAENSVYRNDLFWVAWDVIL